jgi:hypothetical protein
MPPIDIFDPKVHSAASLDSLFDTDARVVRCALAQPAYNLTPPLSAPTDGMPQEIALGFSRTIQLPSPALYLLRDAVAFSRFALSLDDCLVVGLDYLPAFYLDLAPRMLPDSDSLQTARSERVFHEPVYVPWLWKYDEYGHFLTEMLPRILVIRELYGRGLTFPVLIPRAPAYIRDALDSLAPELTLEEVDDQGDGVRCSCCLIPTDGSVDHAFHPHTRELIDAAVKEVVSPASSNGASSRRAVFVSRMKFRSQRGRDFRLLANEERLQRLAEGRGLEVVEPQELSLKEQIVTMRESALIVGEASSALHNAIFAGEAQVISLGWINHVQTLIAGLRSQVLTYLLPSEGLVTRDYQQVRFSEMGPDRQFTISTRDLDAALTSALIRAGLA